MSILSILFIIIVAVVLFFAIQIAQGRAGKNSRFTHQLTYIKSIGIFTLVVGFLGQMVGLTAAFDAIQQVQDISPALLAGGLKVSMICPLTGVFFYLLSVLFWFVLDLWFQKSLGNGQNG